MTVMAAAAVAAPVAVAEMAGGGADESPAQAQPIARNTVVEGAFQGSKDYYDYYSFKAQAGETLRFTLTDTTSSCTNQNDVDQDGCPVYGWLADASNNQLGGSSSGAGGSTSVGPNGADPSQVSWLWKFSQAGTYYIALQDDGDPAIPAGTPSYSIKVTPTSTSTKLVDWVYAKKHQRSKRVHLSFKLARTAGKVKIAVHPVGSTKLAASWKRSDVAAGTHRLALLLSKQVRHRLKTGHTVQLKIDFVFSANGQRVTRTRKVWMAPLT
jgi:hypothetical protein